MPTQKKLKIKNKKIDSTQLNTITEFILDHIDQTLDEIINNLKQINIDIIDKEEIAKIYNKIQGEEKNAKSK